MNQQNNILLLREQEVSPRSRAYPINTETIACAKVYEILGTSQGLRKCFGYFNKF